jgi:energy-coupling factor transport system ATP-binding protein
MIRFERVTYSYPDTRSLAIKDIDLKIDDGAFVLVIGDSGSGKSTLLRCVNGLIPHFYGGRFIGDVTVVGSNTKHETVAGLSRKTGFVFQDATSQAVNKKVEDELAFGLENLGLPPVTIRKRIEEILDQLGISSLRNRDITMLSGGERQKIAIGCALAMQPDTLVLDEPTSELDPNSAEEILSVLQKLNHDLGLTIIISEHRLERVVQYADSAIYLEEGMAVHGSIRDILKDIDLTPPLVTLAKSFGWDPMPLSVKDGRRFSKNMEMRHDIQFDDRQAGPVILDARGLRFSYNGNEVLKGLDITLRAGEIVALMGRNGTGKTTLLRNLCGLLDPDSGSIDRNAAGDTDKHALIGYVPQRPSSLLFAETVKDELKASLELHKRDTSPVDDMLDDIHLTGKADIYPRDLSLGEQQRVAIGSVMVLKPELLIMDEPTHGLDYHNKELLVALLKELAGRGKGVILATHDVELAAQCADRVVLLAEGTIVIDAPAREVLSESMLFSPQVNKLFGGNVMTVDDVMSSSSKGNRK